MIERLLCGKCFQAYVLTVEAADTPLLEQLRSDETVHTHKLLICPRRCGGFLNPLSGEQAEEKAPVFKHALSLTVTEMYQAVYGAGLPDEIPKTLETIDALFLLNAVVHTEIEEKSGKFYLHSILMSNGFTIHLGASSYGPYIVKITKKEAQDGSGNHR